MVILARINQQLNDSLGGLKKRLRKPSDIAISKYLNPELVLFFDVNSRNLALDRMIDCLDQKGYLKDRKVFREAILKREEKVSTGIGLGIAVPHAKIANFDQFFIAIGIQTGGGLEWDSLDGSEVKVVFMIGGPDDKQMEYLKILSSLTMAIKNDHFRKQLFRATSVKEVIDLFEGY